MKIKTAQGFTLIELLIVIAILGILLTIVWLVINPFELLKQGHDTHRLADLQELRTAIDTAAQEATGSGTNILCNQGFTTGSICTYKSYPEGANTRKIDGTGWVPVNLSGQSVTLPTLPIDPNNDNQYHYTYCSDGSSYEIDTVLESQKYAPDMAKDGGDENNTDATGRYEIGSKLTLINATSSCPY